MRMWQYTTLHFQPFYTAQVCSNLIPLQKTEVLQPQRNRVQAETQYHPQHYAQQLVPKHNTQTTTHKYGTTTGDTTHRAQMGHINVSGEEDIPHN
jgi:hypothetical protein